MNKNLHRIVFNEHRGQLMVVAESATANGKEAGGQRDGAGSGLFHSLDRKSVV